VVSGQQPRPVAFPLTQARGAVAGPPGQMKAISGPKLKPMVQGPLTGVLKDLGFDEDQVGCALSDVVMVADKI